MDELIAWTTIPIPIQIYKGVTIEQWYNLTGKQGPNNEGTINIIISFGVSIISYYLFSLRARCQLVIKWQNADDF